MDVTNDGGDDDAAMMAMMGLSGFGSTKVRVYWQKSLTFLLITAQGKHVDGNQGGSVDVKKIRTWRQYMNRSVTCDYRCFALYSFSCNLL